MTTSEEPVKTEVFQDNDHSEWVNSKTESIEDDSPPVTENPLENEAEEVHLEWFKVLLYFGSRPANKSHDKLSSLQCMCIPGTRIRMHPCFF